MKDIFIVEFGFQFTFLKQYNEKEETNLTAHGLFKTINR